MQDPIVIAYHIMWTLYGWWLPNDLRGSTSRVIRSPVLSQLGDLHFGRKRIQPASRDIRAFYNSAKKILKHPLLELDVESIKSVARGFADAIDRFKYTCYACAILRDHVHLIIRKHRHQAEDMIGNLQHHSRLRLSADGFRASDHPVWVDGGWKVFLDHPDDVRRTIGYVDDNPLPYGWAIQHWDFVTSYDGWPLHSGHNQRSPYVRLLRAAGRYPHDKNR
jgi:REP element-mobilizing transposase RayT